MNIKDFAQTQSQFNFTRKPLPRPKVSRQMSREKSQPAFNPVTPQVFLQLTKTKFRIANHNQYLSRDKLQKTSNNFFTQHNNTTESTKVTRIQNQSLLKKHEIDSKQQLFEQYEREEELQFLLLCQTIEKLV